MFSIGKKTLLRVGGRETDVRIRASREGRWLMVDLPHGAPPPDGRVEGVVFQDGALVDWRSRALGALPGLGLLVLSPPETVRTTRVRKSGRIPLVAPVRARRNGSPFDATVCNLSREGMRLACEPELAEGERVTLSLWNFDQPPSGPLPVEVRRIVERSCSTEYGVALVAEASRAAQEYAAFVGRIEAALPALGEAWGRSAKGREEEVPHGPAVLLIDRHRLPARIDGGREGRYLLTGPPTMEGYPLVAPARERLDASLSYLDEGVARAFDTTLLAQFTTPTPVWAWSWPDTMRATPLRQSVRVPLFLAAPVVGEEGVRLATAVDLSEEGALVMEAEGAPRSLLRVGMILSDGKVVDPLAVTVRRVYERNGARFSGVSFDHREGEAYRKLERFYATAVPYAETP